MLGLSDLPLGSFFVVSYHLHLAIAQEVTDQSPPASGVMAFSPIADLISVHSYIAVRQSFQ